MLSVFLIGVLTGCSSRLPQVTLSPQTSGTIEATPTKVIGPTTMETPTPTKVEQQILEQCLAIVPDINNALSGKDYGTILIDRESEKIEIYNKLAKPYLFDLGSSHKTSIDGYGFSVSLDRTKFAYLLRDQDKLLVSDKGGNILATIPTHNDSILRWTNDGLILERGNTHIFLNPVNGETKELLEDFPNRYISDDYFSGIYRDVYFDPAMAKVIYFAKDKKSNEFYFSLWDISKNQEIARIPQPGLGDYGSSAEWSLDGDLVIVRSWLADDQFNFIGIHKDGRKETLLSQNGFSYSLSPDSKIIAFWSYDKAEKNWSLSTLNLQTEQVVDYCIKSKYFPKTPIWSPDSQTLLIEVFTDDGDNTIVSLIDLGRKLAVQIAEDAKPVGWLK